MVEGAHAVRDLLTRYPEQILTIVTAHGYLPKEGQSDRLVRLASSSATVLLFRSPVFKIV